jgi:predicted MFS family arabinose efflux permease
MTELSGTTGSQGNILIPVWASVDLVGQQTFPIVPFLVGASVSALGLSLAHAGQIMSIEYTALALAAIGLAPLMGRLPRRELALAGALIALLGNLLCAFSSVETLSEFKTLALYRGIAGVGYGIALAAGNAAASQVRNPEDLYAKKMVLLAVYSIIAQITSPFIMGNWGAKGLYLTLAIVTAAAITPIFRLPRFLSARQQARHENAASMFNNRWMFISVVIAVFAAAFAFNLREAFTITFVERIGAMKLDVSSQMVGWYLAIGGVLAMGTSLLAAKSAHRYGFAASLVIGVVVSGFVTYGIFVTQTREIFAGLVVMWSPLFYFCWALLMGMAACIDAKGRVAAATGGFVLAAYAVGPGVAGTIIDSKGDAGVATIILWIIAISALLVFVVGRSVDSNRARQALGE